jgi:CRP-like cAMP-binding protein
MSRQLTDAMPDPTRNHLLRILPEADRRRLLPLLEPVWFNLKDVVYEVDAPLDAVYFPTSTVLSEVVLIDGGTAVEVNTVGGEGMAGLAAFLGTTKTLNRMFCQVPGGALRLPVGRLTEYLAEDGAPLHAALHAYVQATMVQLSYNVGCNRLHTGEERTARWLLITHDRVGGDTFPLTQEFLAAMLGVRRGNVSRNAGLLQKAGLIRYTRGQITVIDRQGLEDVACQCYATTRKEFDRLL